MKLFTWGLNPSIPHDRHTRYLWRYNESTSYPRVHYSALGWQSALTCYPCILLIPVRTICRYHRVSTKHNIARMNWEVRVEYHDQNNYPNILESNVEKVIYEAPCILYNIVGNVNGILFPKTYAWRCQYADLQIVDYLRRFFTFGYIFGVSSTFENVV